MPGRILTMQRQVRELGRLRTGYTANNRPVRSKTWILTAKDRNLLDAAAEEWGGQVVEWTPLNSDTKQWSLTTETAALPAFLPPGDPLTQNLEMWSKGGAVRRCNGEVESKSGKPCLCLAQFGPDFHERDPREVCRPYSQLNVMLLGLPDIGVWRHVTKSFYAAGEIAGMVDLIKARVGPEPIVPVWLIIDQRQSVKDGKKTPYPVPVITIRGAASGAALLAGEVPTLELGEGPKRAAIGAGPAPAPANGNGNGASQLTKDHVKHAAREARDADVVRALWKQANRAGVLDEDLAEFLKARVADLAPPGDEPVSAPPAAVEVEADADEPDKDSLWMQVMAAAGAAPRRWNSDELEKRVIARFDRDSGEINGWQMQTFLDELKSGAIQ